MTGRIKSLNAESGSGFITAENDVSVYFHSSAVLAYDITSLRVGQFVSFDLESGSCLRAAHVCVLRHHPVVGVLSKRHETEQIRYLGFDQTESIRAYRFERVSPGEETQTFIVTADLALFRKHRVGMQEGPALCLHRLAAELAASPRPPSQRVLTDADVLAHVASRPAPASRPRFKPTPRPQPVSHPV